MESSKLYDLLARAVINDWQEEEEKDSIECVINKEAETEAELLNKLPESCKDTLRLYRLAIEERVEYLHYKLQVKILNLGIKIGMDLEEAFASYEE